MKQLTFVLWLGLMGSTFAQSVQVSIEAGLNRYRNVGSGQAERYGLNVRTPVTTGRGPIGYTAGIYARLITNSPFFFQIGLRNSGQEVGVQYVDLQPNIPTTEDDIDVSYAGNYLYRFDAPVLAGLGVNISPNVRLEGYGGLMPTLNKYKYTGDYQGRFSWTAQVIDQSLKPFSWGYLFGTTLWLKRWGVTLAREGNINSLNRDVMYKGQQHPFATGFRNTRVSISYCFGSIGQM